MRLLLAAGLLTSLGWVGRAHAGGTEAPGCDAMVGVWEYVKPSAPGHAIIAKQGTKYLGIFVNTLPELRLTLRWLYSSYQPQDVGSQAIIEVEVAGRQAKWWFIGADGKRGAMGAGRRLE